MKTDILIAIVSATIGIVVATILIGPPGGCRQGQHSITIGNMLVAGCPEERR